jgi:uncharacterized UPF0160 family protein
MDPLNCLGSSDATRVPCFAACAGVPVCPAEGSIVRSRDAEVLKDCDVVIDVGGVYEPDNNRFDHHQRGFTEVFGHGFNTKLSSAGVRGSL